MSEKAGPKKEEFNSNVGISTCKKYIGTGEARYVVHYFHISFLRNQGEIMEYISSQKSQYLKSNQFVFVGAAAHLYIGICHIWHIVVTYQVFLVQEKKTKKCHQS